VVKDELHICNSYDGSDNVYGHASGHVPPYRDSGSRPVEKRSLISNRDNQHQAVQRGQPFLLSVQMQWSEQ
jgi:hypothetical protein